MVRIRLQRHGRKNRPYYRLVAADSRSPRDGRMLEILGTYDPLQTDEAKLANLNAERIQHWLAVGAQPSETATSLLKRIGVALPWVERAAVKKAAAVAEKRKDKPARGPKAKRAPKAAGEPAAPVDASSKKAKREAKRLT